MSYSLAICRRLAPASIFLHYVNAHRQASAIQYVFNAMR
jgi:hypothetical protein